MDGANNPQSSRKQKLALKGELFVFAIER